MIGPGSRLRPWVRGVVLVAAPIVVVALFAAATYTPLFGLRTLRVEGTTVVTKADVARLAGLSSSTNVYHLDTARIEAALAADPWIGGAEVERRLPGTVEIRITERVPVAQTLRGEVPEAVAADGVLLPEAPTDGLPEIRAAIGDLSDVDRAAAATAVAAMMPSLRERVRALIIDVGDELRIELTGGLRVEFGTGGDASAKAGALRSVLGWAVRDRVTLRTVDVSVPGAPSAILADGSTFTG